jgi:hypothetical protein
MIKSIQIDDKVITVEDARRLLELLNIVFVAYWPLVKPVRVVPWTASWDGQKITIAHDNKKLEGK